MRSVKKIVCPFAAPVIAGVSGGVDSLTLADMLWRRGGADFAVAHCNFHLRGEESDGDADFVRKWAAERGVKFHCIDFDTAGYAASRKISVEMAARELRYGWFAVLCRRYGYGAVAIAHNANDNAETLILNLIRGTGLRGICGMQEISVQKVAPCQELSAALGCPPSDFPETLDIWRPLLGMTRCQIEGYARKYGLHWREDRTNGDSEYKRNLIRNEIIPLLERINPSAVKTLNRDMGYFNEARRIVDGYFSGEDSLLGTISARGEGWRYALYLCLEKYSFSGAVIGQVENLLDSGRTVSGKIFFSPTHRLIMTSSSFIVEPLDRGFSNGGSFVSGCASIGCDASAGGGSRSEAGSSSCLSGSVVVAGPGEIDFNGCHISVELFDRDGGFNPKQPEGVTAIDADKVPFPLTLRRWNDGDWMRPLGCGGRKKVSDIFTDLKFSLPQKRSAILLESPSKASALKTPASATGSAGISDGTASAPVIVRPDTVTDGIPAIVGTDALAGGTPAVVRSGAIKADIIKAEAPASRRVLALLGRRVDESVRITPQTRRILRFTLRDIQHPFEGKI